jgi:hypothetical protein
MAALVLARRDPAGEIAICPDVVWIAAQPDTSPG